MRFKLLLLVFILIIGKTAALAQTLFKVSGTVLKANGDTVSNANIRINEIRKTVSSDSIGNYTLNLKEGKYTLVVTAVGLQKVTRIIAISQDLRLDLVLSDEASDLNEVVISGKNNNRSLESPQMGAEKLTMDLIKNIPIIFGERDILKAIQLLPGIKSAGEGSSGFYVRGGSADQNLILMDEVPVYNASHLLGFFSTFNPDVVEDVTVYKTGMPATFGGRLSSVLDVKMKQPNKDRFQASGGIGLISSKLTLEAPIQKGKSSFLISGRRTYVDALLRLSPDSTLNQNTLYFYDLNARLDFDLGKRTKLNFTGYLGSDRFGLEDTFGISWGNVLGSGQLKHAFSDRFSSTTTAAFTSYQNKVELNVGSSNFRIFSKIDDISFRQNFLWQQSNNHVVKFGVQSIYHTVTPGEITTNGQSNFNPTFYQKRFSLENAAFASSDWQIAPKFNLSTGLRLSGFSIFGQGEFLSVDQNGNVLNTESFSKGEHVKTYLNLEPRLAMSYLVNDQSSIKGSYVRNTQNMHLISNSTTSRPTDKWLASTKMIKPELSDQYSLGYYRNLIENRYELNVETYYKNMQNQIDYRDGADVFDADAIERQLLYGIGRAYGVELLLKKKSGNLTGWIGYTLSKTERKINGINNSNWYNARQDRTHDIAVVAMYQLSKKWNVSATWIYYTGDAVTFPAGKYFLDGQTFFYYTDRNASRMPSYHRLDLGANLQLKKKKNYTSELSFSLYNAYGRKNAYALSFEESETNRLYTNVVQTTLFKFVPSISYNFRFL